MLVISIEKNMTIDVCEYFIKLCTCNNDCYSVVMKCNLFCFDIYLLYRECDEIEFSDVTKDEDIENLFQESLKWTGVKEFGKEDNQFD